MPELDVPFVGQCVGSVHDAVWCPGHHVQLPQERVHQAIDGVLRDFKNQHAKKGAQAITDLGVLLQPILTNQAAVVIGSRSLENNSASRIKWRHPHPLTYIGNLLIVWLIKVLYQRKGNDFFACYKIMPRRLLEDLKVEARDFSYDIELLCKLFRKNIVITTAPIHYNPRTFAEGKKITYSDGLKALWAIGKWRFKKI